MIGSGLQKLAKENSMTVKAGVAYGSLQGFTATLSEGAGFKRIVFSTPFADPGKRTELTDLINATNVRKLYRVQLLHIGPRLVQVDFLDNPGTMKKVRAFLDWFIPLLREHDAAGTNVCAECGCEVDAGRWVMVDGVVHRMHDSCAQRVEQQIEAENIQQKEERKGSYLMGLVGALLGSTVGAVLWAIVLNMGYVASLVGLVIGWLAEKGYDLLKGKQGKAKVLILILTIIFGVLLGTFGADAMTLAGMIGGGELPGFAYGDIPAIIMALLMGDSEYASAVVGNILLGLLFAGLGVFALLRNAGKNVADTGFQYL